MSAWTASTDTYELEGIWEADGLTAEAAADLRQCVDTWQAVSPGNTRKERVYEGRQGLAKLPDNVPARYRGLELPCPWPEVAVNSVAERSIFDGFVFAAESDATRRLQDLSRRLDIGLAYQSALIGTLVHGCSFVAVVRDAHGPSLRWHSARSASALWDWAAQRVRCGFAIVGRRRRGQMSTGDYIADTEPAKVDYYTSGGVWELTRGAGTSWVARWMSDRMGEPRLIALRYRPDDLSPLGHSRISSKMEAIAQEYMSLALDLHCMAEYNAVGQKWVTGLTDAQLATFAAEKWRLSGDSVVMVTDNPDSGNNPQFGSFVQQSPEGLLSIKRSIAMDFAALASVPISEILTQDSNPTSAEALAAAKDKLIALVESTNLRNSESLRRVALQLMAIDQGKSIDELGEAELGVIARWRDPSTPTAAAQADATLKISSVVDGYGQTDVCLERLGFDEAERARIDAQRAKAGAREAVHALMRGGS